MIASELLIGFGATGVTVIGHIFIANYRINQNEKSLIDVWRWKDSHVKEAGELREKYQTQISELRGAIMVTGEQFKQIMTALEDIKSRISALENHRNAHN